MTVTAGEPTSACGKQRFFVWKKRANPGEANSIRKPDLFSVAAVAFENRVIGDKPAAGSLWIYGIIFGVPAIAFQRARPKRMVGMGIGGVMVVMAVVCPMAVV